MKLNLEPTDSIMPIGVSKGQLVLCLCAFSGNVIPRQKDWDSQIKLTGCWFLEEEYSPSQELHDFLYQPELPVYFGIEPRPTKNLAVIANIISSTLWKLPQM